MDNQVNKSNTWTISELLGWTAKDFEKCGISTARLDAEILLSEAMEVKRVDLYMRYDETPDSSSVIKFREMVKRRRKREPVAYIIGERGFHDITLKVPHGRFIPRPETELLVDEAVSRIKDSGLKTPRLLDICTGTGAIALAALHAQPNLTAIAVDIDPTAEKTVMENARRLGLQQRIKFWAGDLFEPVKEMGAFDIIVCNPPYIISSEIDELMEEVRDYEPRLALDGGADGFDIINRLVEQTPKHLKQGGWLLIEVGEGQAQKTAGIGQPAFEHEFTRDDLSHIPRIVILRKK